MARDLVLLLAPDGVEASALEERLQPRLEFTRASEAPPDFDGVELVWLHRGIADEDDVLDAQLLRRLGDFVERGGRLLLTGAAAAWTGDLGFESRPPTRRSRVWQGPIREEERLGVAPFFDHPLFARFPGGVYLRKPWSGCRIGGAFYSGNERPVEGRLIGVERVWLGVNAELGLLVEHEVGHGHVLSLGAHLEFADAGRSEDPFEEERLRFAVDCCEYLLAGEPPSHDAAWPRPGCGARVSPGTLEVAAPTTWPEPRALAQASSIESAGDASVDLVGRDGSLLLLDGEGVQELWALPLRFVDEMRWTRGGVALHAAAMQVQPGLCERRGGWGVERIARRATASGAGEFVGRISVGASRPHEAARANGDAGADSGADASREREALELVVGGDQRALWPYPERVMQAEVASSEDGRVLRIRDARLGTLALLAFDVAPRSTTLEVTPQGAWRFCASFAPEVEELSWRCMFGDDDSAASNPWSQCDAATPARLEVDFAEPNIDSALVWLRHGVESLFVEVDGRAGFLAGVDATRPGWCSGRPGYSWFFGRDSLWISRFVLPWGFQEEVAATLETLAAHQGPRGEILHELTPAGVALYDAADSTPLFVDVLARYFDWSGDLELVQTLWPRAKRAIAFVQAHDRDGDGITENRGVGHGWTEGGDARGQIQAELYLACAQFAGLEAAVRLARLVGDDANAAAWDAASQRVREVVMGRFLDSDSGLYAFALRDDGLFDRRPSALAIMPILVGMAGPDQAAAVLERLDAADFASDWGIRLFARGSADPAEHQGSSVWPMWTAMLALAHFKAGSFDRGCELLRTQIGLLEGHNPGVLAEVLHGERQEAIGLCRHYALSHAATMGAITEGLLGLDVRDGRLFVDPRAENFAGSCRLRGLPLGGQRIDLEFRDGSPVVDGASNAVEVVLATARDQVAVT